MLEDINYLQLVPSVELLFADPIEIVDRNLRSWTGAGDVECQDVFGQVASTLIQGRCGERADMPAKPGPAGPTVAMLEQEMPRTRRFGPS